MTSSRKQALVLLEIMRKQAAEREAVVERREKRGPARRALSGAGKGAIGGATVGAAIPLLAGLPSLARPEGEDRKEVLKRMLGQMLSGAAGGAAVGAPIGATGEALLGSRYA